MAYNAAAPNVVGIGPVIAGRQTDGRPAYYIDVVQIDGTQHRHWWCKRSRGADRKAKLEAVLSRIRMAADLRRTGGCILAHDRNSFEMLCRMLIQQQGSTYLTVDGQALPDRRRSNHCSASHTGAFAPLPGAS